LKAGVWVAVEAKLSANNLANRVRHQNPEEKEDVGDDGAAFVSETKMKRNLDCEQA